MVVLAGITAGSRGVKGLDRNYDYIQWVRRLDEWVFEGWDQYFIRGFIRGFMRGFMKPCVMK
jgi:hypothetical protein